MRKRYAAWPLLTPLGLALLGFWLPWLAPDSVGLQLNGFELSDWVMLSPDVLYRAYPLSRLSFLAVTACLTVAFGLALGRARLGRGWRVWFSRPGTWALAAGLAASFFTTLPYFPHALIGWREPEWQRQWLVAIGALGLALVGVVAPGWLARLGLVGLAVAGAWLAYQAWMLTQPLAQGLIGSAPTGIGWLLCLAGWAGSLLVAAFDLGQERVT